MKRMKRMKRTSPFTRHQLELESLTAPTAGLENDLRRRKVMPKGSSRKVVPNRHFLWLLLEPKAKLRAALRLVHEEHGWKDDPRVASRAPRVNVSLRGQLGR